MSELMKQILIPMGMRMRIASNGQTKRLLCNAMFDIIARILENRIEISYSSYWLNNM